VKRTRIGARKGAKARPRLGKNENNPRECAKADFIEGIEQGTERRAGKRKGGMLRTRSTDRRPVARNRLHSPESAN
jgi:hypothetical protein